MARRLSTLGRKNSSSHRRGLRITSRRELEDRGEEDLKDGFKNGRACQLVLASYAEASRATTAFLGSSVQSEAATKSRLLRGLG
jgi:hypothetical protein